MDKMEHFLGLAMRAGKVFTGEERVVKAVQMNKVHLVIVAADGSENTRKKLRDKCRTYQVEYLEFGDRYTLGKVTGRGQQVVIGIADKGFANQLCKLASS